ncbi:hypothetical protein HBB16_18495 [Pseudonocardia sp. MCCB 268]|nr:hypothetical protein [Pseudonocardia cytotoxica]
MLSIPFVVVCLTLAMWRESTDRQYSYGRRHGGSAAQRGTAYHPLGLHDETGKSPTAPAEHLARRAALRP